MKGSFFQVNWVAEFTVQGCFHFLHSLFVVFVLFAFGFLLFLHLQLIFFYQFLCLVALINSIITWYVKETVSKSVSYLIFFLVQLQLCQCIVVLFELFLQVRQLFGNLLVSRVHLWKAVDDLLIIFCYYDVLADCFHFCQKDFNDYLCWNIENLNQFKFLFSVIQSNRS